jgi:hypothetical protein
MFTFPTTLYSGEAAAGSALLAYVQSLDNVVILVDPRAGGSAITESGGFVTNIENLGSSADLEQGTGGSQATWDGDKLIFDRDFYTLVGTPSLSIQSVVAVLKVDTADGANCLLANTTTGQSEVMTSTPSSGWDQDTDTLLKNQLNTNGITTSTAVLDDVVQVVSGVRVGGALSFGTTFALGRQSAALSARDFKGELLFFAAFGDALTTAEENNILSLVATEFSITTLPLIDHDDIAGIADCVVGIDAVLSTITEASGEVSNVENLGSGNDAVQATGTKQPDTGNVTLNGKNVLHFDGGDCLTIASLNLDVNLTWFAVTTSTTGMVYEHGNGAEDGGYCYGAGVNACQIRRGVNSASLGDSNWLSGNSYISIYYNNGTTFKNYRSGSNARQSASSTSVTGSANKTLNIGARNDAASLGMSADIACLYGFARALSVDEINQIGSVLARTFGPQPYWFRVTS